MDKLVSNVKGIYEIHMINCISDSMEPHIMEGDLCMIGVGVPFKDGEVYTPDGVAIKECYMQGDELVLVSYNPIYTPVRFWQCECKIIGRFVGIFRGV
ncbi:S24 family peptidase [Campylobacter fetus]|nr:S24 family peptidase [Campylobacter fetus]